MEGGTRSNKSQNEEVNHSDIKEDITDSDDNDDASIFSIASGYSSEDDDALADENNVKSTVPTKGTGSNNAESTDGFLLT